ncbi:MAG: hypothetical protein ABUL66_01160 [Verrucomicrobiota bacterium]
MATFKRAKARAPPANKDAANERIMMFSFSREGREGGEGKKVFLQLGFATFARRQ